MLECKNITIGLGNTFLWENFSFQVSASERVGIFAASGKGKSTLARVIAGWQKPTSGAVLLDGQPLAHKGYSPIQLVPQHPELTFNPWRSTGDSVRDAWSPDATTIQRLEIHPEWLSRRPDQLSGGELARIALLRALDPRTRYLIADEATAQLDPSVQQNIWKFLLEVSFQRPLGLIVISHQYALLAQVSANNFIYNAKYGHDAAPVVSTAESLA